MPLKRFSPRLDAENRHIARDEPFGENKLFVVASRATASPVQDATAIVVDCTRVEYPIGISSLDGATVIEMSRLLSKPSEIHPPLPLE